SPCLKPPFPGNGHQQNSCVIRPRHQAGRHAGGDTGGRGGGFPIRSETCPPLPPDESRAPQSASLFPDDGHPPHERRLRSLVKADEATQIDELIEKLESAKSSSEMFAARFGLDRNGKVRQRPVSNFVKSS